MRLIDADKLKEYVSSISSGLLCEWDTLGVLSAIDKQQTVDADPVAHGYWIRHDIELDDECSNCHEFSDRQLMCYAGIPSTRYEQHPYCPWCGAKMTGDFIYDL